MNQVICRICHETYEERRGHGSPDPTHLQGHALDLFVTMLRGRGRSPRLREVGQLLGVAGTAPVIEMLESLERKGYLRRDPSDVPGGHPSWVLAEPAEVVDGHPARRQDLSDGTGSK